MKRLKNDAIWAAVFLLLALARLLPLRAALAVGRALGALGCLASRGERRRALANLTIAFPDAPPPARARLARRAFAHLGETVAAIACLPRAVARTRVDIDEASRRALADALACERGVVFISAHTGNWELLAAHVGRLIVPRPIAIVVRRVYDLRIDARLRRLRHAAGVGTLVERGPGDRRHVVDTLRSKGVVGLLLDQSVALPGEAIPFFGRRAWTPTAPATYAARRGIPVLAGFGTRIGPLHHRIAISRIPPTTGAINDAIEAAIRRAPEQWVWTHRRWDAIAVPSAPATGPIA
ncbi:MAG: lysophospholipid acyltransferase family protein [Myxococcota bacterium]